MTNNITFRLLAFISFSACTPLLAQDIHFTQFKATPLTLNPAFTGMFNGAARVSALYRTNWKTEQTVYSTVDASFDMPVMILKNGSYFAAGGQISHAEGGYGYFNNVAYIGSAAYHQLFGRDSSGHHCSDLAFGIQGGYAQQWSNLTNDYFDNQPSPQMGIEPFINPYIKYYMVNAGISFSGTISQHLNYTLGLSANNLNRPVGPTTDVTYDQANTNLRYTGEAGVNWIVTNGFSIHPAIIYMEQSTFDNVIAGSEFQYKLTKHPNAIGNILSIFLGGWYRTGNTHMITAGTEAGRLRVGISVDFRSQDPDHERCLEVMVRYVAPGSKKSSHRKAIPCNRF